MLFKSMLATTRQVFTLLAPIMMIASGPLLADDENKKTAPYQGHMGLSLSYLNGNESFTRAVGVAKNSPAFDAYYGASFYRYFLFNVGFGLVLTRDEDQVSQEVERNGRVSTEKTNTTGISAFAEIGGQYRFATNDRMGAGFLAGYRYFNINRSIDNCTNCIDNDLDFKSTAYLKPFIDYRYNEYLAFNLAYSHFLDDTSFGSSISFGVEFQI